MTSVHITKIIQAPVHEVFRTVADIREFAKANPKIIKVEFLTEVQVGVGARFRETRRMNDSEMQTTLEVAEYTQDEMVRLVAIDPMGTIWDTVFTVHPEQDATVLTMTMDAHPRKWWMKFFLWMIGGVLRVAVAADLERVKEYCEKGASDPFS